MLLLPVARHDITEIYFQKMKIKELVELRKNNFGYPMFDISYNSDNGEWRYTQYDDSSRCPFIPTRTTTIYGSITSKETS